MAARLTSMGCLLVVGLVAAGLVGGGWASDGGGSRHIRRITASELPPAPDNGTAPAPDGKEVAKPPEMPAELGAATPNGSLPLGAEARPPGGVDTPGGGNKVGGVDTPGGGNGTEKTGVVEAVEGGSEVLQGSGSTYRTRRTTTTTSTTTTTTTTTTPAPTTTTPTATTTPTTTTTSASTTTTAASTTEPSSKRPKEVNINEVVSNSRGSPRRLRKPGAGAGAGAARRNQTRPAGAGVDARDNTVGVALEEDILRHLTTVSYAHYETDYVMEDDGETFDSEAQPSLRNASSAGSLFGGGGSYDVTTPRTDAFDEEYARISEGIQQRVEEMEEHSRVLEAAGGVGEEEAEAPKNDSRLSVDFTNHLDVVANRSVDGNRRRGALTLENGTHVQVEHSHVETRVVPSVSSTVRYLLDEDGATTEVLPAESEDQEPEGAQEEEVVTSRGRRMFPTTSSTTAQPQPVNTSTSATPRGRSFPSRTSSSYTVTRRTSTESSEPTSPIPLSRNSLYRPLQEPTTSPRTRPSSLLYPNITQRQTIPFTAADAIIPTTLRSRVRFTPAPQGMRTPPPEGNDIPRAPSRGTVKFPGVSTSSLTHDEFPIPPTAAAWSLATMLGPRPASTLQLLLEDGVDRPGPTPSVAEVPTTTAEVPTTTLGADEELSFEGETTPTPTDAPDADEGGATTTPVTSATEEAPPTTSAVGLLLMGGAEEEERFGVPEEEAAGMGQAEPDYGGPTGPDAGPEVDSEMAVSTTPAPSLDEVLTTTATTTTTSTTVPSTSTSTTTTTPFPTSTSTSTTTTTTPSSTTATPSSPASTTTTTSTTSTTTNTINFTTTSEAATEMPTERAVSADNVSSTEGAVPGGATRGAPTFLRVFVEATPRQFCDTIGTFKQAVAELLTRGSGRIVSSDQVILRNFGKEECSLPAVQDNSTSAGLLLPVELHLVDEAVNFDRQLNEAFPLIWGQEDMDFPLRILKVDVVAAAPEEPLGGPTVDSAGVIAAIAISCIGALCLLLLAVLLVIMRKRQKKFNYGMRCTPVSLDAYSLDSVSIHDSVRRKAGLRASKRSYGNPGFDDPTTPSHPLNFAGLTAFSTERGAIEEEFSRIPTVSPKADELPPGSETKNRYANVLPLPETRVLLSARPQDPLSDYINANYVTGPKNTGHLYIACQAPLPSTVTDFWRMIWEQQSRVILMLTELTENGVEKCADYLPPSEVLDCHRLFGDFQITLKKREVREKYVISTLQLKNLESNSWREVTHLWYVSWPTTGVPDEASSVIAFLIEARSYMKQRSGPAVVHCSPGTGRTGAVLACDLGIREFELSRHVDVPRCVARLRRDRAGCVQTRDQYAFIYEVLTLYATKLTGGALDSI